MFWVLVTAAAAFIIYFIFIKPFNYWKEKGVPSYSCWNIVSTFLLGFIRYQAVEDVIVKIYNDFPDKRYAGIYQFFKPVLSIRDPDLIKQITVKDFDHFVDHSQFFPDNTEPIWERNLIVLKGNEWRHMRTTVSPSFTASKMKILFELISECGKEFIEYFKNQNSEVVELEMKEVFTKFANDVIASSVFGVKCDSLRDPDNEFYRMAKRASNFSGVLESLKLVFCIMFPRLAKKLGMTVFEKRMINFFTKLVKDNIQQREKNQIVRPDMIHLLMQARKDKSKTDDSNNEESGETQRLADIDIAAQAMIFFFAGFHTISTLMSFMAYEIAINPDIQERLQQEIDDVLVECNGKLTYEAAAKMKYMDMVISETLRKWPASGALDRVCVKPYTIQPINSEESPVNLKKGDVVSLAVFSLHRDPEIYPEPLRFDPEKFSDENKSNINPYTYLPFGVGPRNCIGNRFAMMEVKLAFFHILSNFDLTVTAKTAIPLKVERFRFELYAVGGVWLGLKRRNVS